MYVRPYYMYVYKILLKGSAHGCSALIYTIDIKLSILYFQRTKKKHFDGLT